ncbi:uncharacterized protein LOC101756197 [Setaria italica]|uniref:Uncharacterized protein n=1 Tax=Setaria italica TaxID=4555 RepID=K3ZEV5_SETIT|nr:uncharacterized protein LOC101756197 [Setaria italica]
MDEIPTAQCLYDDDEEMLAALRELVEDDDDQGLAEDFRALRSVAVPLENASALSPEFWDWVDSVELIALRAAEILAREAADIQRALSLLSRRPGPEDEAFVAALRRQAVSTAARRADTEGFAATTRRIREKELRRMAAVEHLVHPTTAGFLGYIAGETDASLARGEAPDADELALAPQVEDAAVWMEESMAALAGRLRCSVAEFAARPRGPARRTSSPRWRGRPPPPTRRAPQSRRSPRPCAGSSLPPAAQPDHAWRITIYVVIQFLHH